MKIEKAENSFLVAWNCHGDQPERNDAGHLFVVDPHGWKKVV